MIYSVDHRNGDFVNFAAAFAGRISTNCRAIDFSASGPASFGCRVVLRHESAEDRQQVAEALEDFEAMRRPHYELPFQVACEIVVSAEHIPHPASHELRLFGAREND